MKAYFKLKDSGDKSQGLLFSFLFFFFFETGFHYVAQSALELAIFLPQLRKQLKLQVCAATLSKSQGLEDISEAPCQP
jgi:hypothetical protein